MAPTRASSSAPRRSSGRAAGGAPERYSDNASSLELRRQIGEKRMLHNNGGW